MSRYFGQNADSKAAFTEEEIAEGETLLGWLDPLQLPTAWSGDTVNALDMMHRLVIFKRPLEEEFPERKRFLIEIRKTVIHELAHHFGWTDADLERFDDNPDPFRDDFNELLGEGGGERPPPPA